MSLFSWIGRLFTSSRMTTVEPVRSELSIAQEETNTSDSEDSFTDGFLAVVIDNSNVNVTVFGPFLSPEEAYLWDAGIRVSIKRMFEDSGESIVMGESAVLPIGSVQADRYIELAGGLVIDPSDEQWQLIGS